MQYISPKNEYPRFYGDIMNQHSGWKLGDELPTGWKLVADAEPPVRGEYEVLYEEAPIEVDGVLTQNWKVRDMTTEEKERHDAPKTAREKLVALGFNESEIEAISRGVIA